MKRNNKTKKHRNKSKKRGGNQNDFIAALRQMTATSHEEGYEAIDNIINRRISEGKLYNPLYNNNDVINSLFIALKVKYNSPNHRKFINNQIYKVLMNIPVITADLINHCIGNDVDPRVINHIIIARNLLETPEFTNINLVRELIGNICLSIRSHDMPIAMAYIDIIYTFLSMSESEPVLNYINEKINDETIPIKDYKNLKGLITEYLFYKQNGIIIPGEDINSYLV